MYGVLIVLGFEFVKYNFAILVLCRWETAYLPAERQTNGYIVQFFEGILEVNGMHALSVLKDALL